MKFHFMKENVSNRHIVEVLEVKSWMDSMWIIMTLCDLGDLNEFFQKNLKKLKTTMRVDIMTQIARGVAFLHSKNIVHRDIKPGNILLKTEDGCAVVKLAWFPLGLENLEKWEGIFQSGKSQGILNRLEKSGKITQNTGKVGEFEINII